VVGRTPRSCPIRRRSSPLGRGASRGSRSVGPRWSSSPLLAQGTQLMPPQVAAGARRTEPLPLRKLVRSVVGSATPRVGTPLLSLPNEIGDRNGVGRPDGGLEPEPPGRGMITRTEQAKRRICLRVQRAPGAVRLSDPRLPRGPGLGGQDPRQADLQRAVQHGRHRDGLIFGGRGLGGVMGCRIHKEQVTAW
jgi:hypothetical protein